MNAALALALGLSGPSWGFWPFQARLLTQDPLKEIADLAQGGRHEEVLARTDSVLFRKDLRHWERKRAYLLIGSSLEALGRHDRALSHYQIAAQYFPKDADVLVALARVFHRTGLDDKARPHYERVLELDSDNAEAHLGLAESYHALGLLDEAVRHYRDALEADGRAPTTWLQYAKALAAQRDFFNAEQAALKSGLSSAEALELRAVYQHHQGRSSQALASLEDAVGAAPSDPALRARKALWLLKAGRDEAGLKELGAALAERPGYPLALWARGLARLRAGRRAEALEDFRQVKARGRGFVSRSAAAMLEAASR